MYICILPEINGLFKITDFVTNYLMLKSDAHAKISAANQLLLDIREKPYIEPTHLLQTISHLGHFLVLTKLFIYLYWTRVFTLFNRDIYRHCDSFRLNKVSLRKYVYFFYCGSISKCIQIFWDSLYFCIQLVGEKSSWFFAATL